MTSPGVPTMWRVGSGPVGNVRQWSGNAVQMQQVITTPVGRVDPIEPPPVAPLQDWQHDVQSALTEICEGLRHERAERARQLTALEEALDRQCGRFGSEIDSFAHLFAALSDKVKIAELRWSDMAEQHRMQLEACNSGVGEVRACVDSLQDKVAKVSTENTPERTEYGAVSSSTLAELQQTIMQEVAEKLQFAEMQNMRHLKTCRDEFIGDEALSQRVGEEFGLVALRKDVAQLCTSVAAIQRQSSTTNISQHAVGPDREKAHDGDRFASEMVLRELHEQGLQEVRELLSGEVGQLQSELEEKLGLGKGKTLSKTLETLREQCQKAERMAEERALESASLKTEVVAEMAEKQSEIRKLVAELGESTSETHTNFSMELGANHDRVVHQNKSAKAMEERIEALEGLAKENAKEASSLRTEVESRHSDLHKLHGELRSSHETQGLNTFDSHKKLESDLADHDSQLSQHHVTFHRVDSDICVLQNGVMGHAEEMLRLRAELAEASQKLDATIHGKVQALAVQHGSELDKRADEIQGTILRCDALFDEMCCERRSRVAVGDQLAKDLKDEIIVLESRQTDLLQENIMMCLSHNKDCHLELRAEHETQSVAHSRDLESISSELERASAAGRVAMDDQVKDLDAKHSIALHQEIKGRTKQCEALLNEFQVERGDRLTSSAELRSEVLVKLNCTQKQCENYTTALGEAFTSQVHVLRDQVIPGLKADLNTKTEALQAEIRESSAEAQKQLGQALENSLDREGRLVDQLSATMTEERHERVAESATLRRSLAEEIGVLHCRVDEQTALLSRRIDGSAQELAHRIEAQGQELTHGMQEQGKDLAEKLDRTSCTMQANAMRFSTQLDDQRGYLSNAIEDQDQRFNASLDETNHRMNEQGRDLGSTIEDQNLRYADQAGRTGDALQALMEAKVEEAKVMTQDLHYLQEEIHGVKHGLPADIKQAMGKLRGEQEAQMRLLAEDSDQKAQQLLMHLQAEADQREALGQEVKRWSDETSSLRYDISGLRSLIHADPNRKY
eukprot:CAMPEP_0203916970 /NCGR_PEP_ID=MMETSP0359-20131031/57617_1 /ASSEMBLY_ACC=CAM_ASM_000338 /TAXON_ID=268821 /ORGANISM="Scrippsiella Hangoei, Strain SHTV-5" /LENGTH=1024 /DNA_ID=CAMNT_0050843755 /DNA_START=30 /DNA_END=3104 /DNA_ORIENTATION=+